MTGPQLTWNSQLFPSCSPGKQTINRRLKPPCSVSMDANDSPASFNYTKSFQPPLTLGHVPAGSAITPWVPLQMPFSQKASAQWTVWRNNKAASLKLRIAKFFTKIKGRVKGARQKRRLYHRALEHCWKFLQAVRLFILESNFFFSLNSEHKLISINRQSEDFCCPSVGSFTVPLGFIKKSALWESY